MQLQVRFSRFTIERYRLFSWIKKWYSVAIHVNMVLVAFLCKSFYNLKKLIERKNFCSPPLPPPSPTSKKNGLMCPNSFQWFFRFFRFFFDYKYKNGFTAISKFLLCKLFQFKFPMKCWTFSSSTSKNLLTKGWKHFLTQRLVKNVMQSSKSSTTSAKIRLKLRWNKDEKEITHTWKQRIISIERHEKIRIE